MISLLSSKPLCQGGDVTTSATDIPQYAVVRYQDFYPNIDLLYQAGAADPSHLEYDYIVKPGGDPSAIQFTVNGAPSLNIDTQGNLVITTPGGVLTESFPTTTAVGSDGTIQPVSTSFVLLGNNTVGLQVTGSSPDQTLTIDPTLSYSTYLGGNSTDLANGITVDAAGNVYVAGTTQSTNFPGTTGSFGGLTDAFVARLLPTGNALAYGTYLGGPTNDTGTGIAVDAAGNAYVTGSTFGNFPVTSGAYQTSAGHNNNSLSFVTKLNAAGDNMVYSSYLGGNQTGSGNDGGNAVAVDGAGNCPLSRNSCHFSCLML